ncbi:MAG: polyribonucleotide nucleotidyltransferase [Bacillus sp. (in: Bacteria)]|nr:polyribonucleotide nucleotidyltransferase [Bacillus sp. (in: firmicutes)]
MVQDKHTYTIDWAGRPLTVEIGQLAKQANGAALVRYGETAVLSTATASKEPKNVDFFPLTVNYEERLYAVGKIPGGFIKREGRPSEKAILSSRLIDRPIRPLFADGFRNEVQVVSMVMSVDQDCTPEMAAMLGSSLALSVSDIPFEGPIAGVIVGRVDGKFLINPTVEQMEKSDIHLTVAGTKDAINMVEAGAKEVPEEVMLEAIMFGHEEIKRLIAFQEKIVAEIGKEKMAVELFELDEELVEKVSGMCRKKMIEAIQVHEKKAREEAIRKVGDEVLAQFEAEEADEETVKQVKQILHDIEKEEVRKLITVDKIRPDGRKIDEIRPLSSEVGVLPRTHGSGLFTRGQTQALSICTLGALGDVQILDGLGIEESKRFMHHYNFPPYCVGETSPMRSPGRREIGHGTLGEKALLPVIPDEDEFPYTIRIVSEVLESNGSSSQASICGSTLALMAGGVPIKKPVAGIAMGLMKKDDDIVILSDIQGFEDFNGDMDFKVAGTEDGITALQMDIKLKGLSYDILEEALNKAKTGRMHIMDKMLEVIPETRPELSENAPAIISMNIDPEKIRFVIGPGGKTINKIIDETGADIDIEDDGLVKIMTEDQEGGQKAKEMIERLTKEVEVGEIYQGKVKRIMNFGAFVEILPNKEGLVHISKLADHHVKEVGDVVSVGDEIPVKVIEIDNQDRINLSLKDAKKEQKDNN